jgi:hypothetical protein
MNEMMMWLPKQQQSHGHHRQEALQGLQVFGGSLRRASPRNRAESEGSWSSAAGRDHAAEYGDGCLSPVRTGEQLALMLDADSPPAAPYQSAGSSGLPRTNDLAGSIAAAVGGSRMNMQELDRMEKLAKDAADEKVRVDKVTKDAAKAAAKAAAKQAKDDGSQPVTAKVAAKAAAKQARDAAKAAKDDGSQPAMMKRPAAAPNSKDGLCKVEWSRQQVVAVSGKTGPGSSKVFSFKAHGGDDGARKKARKWLAEQNA